MAISNQLLVFFLFIIVSQVSSQSYYQSPLTCYTKHEHEETLNQASNNVLGYAYSQAETTQYSTPEGELCSNVGCTCFSYKSACSYSSHESNHYSPCTDADRHNRIVKWHRGLTSISKCEQMRQQPQTYIDLTCCHTDRCNDQPGKITKIVQSHIQPQRYDTYVHPTAPHSLVSHKPPQHYDGSAYRTAAHVVVTDKPNQSYDRSLQTNNSPSSIFLSSWMICFALVFRLIINP